MNFKSITDQAKKLVDQRGGTESLKGDLDELKDIAKGKGSLTDKAKAAADALKEPGKRDGAPAASGDPAPAPAPTPPTPPAAG